MSLSRKEFLKSAAIAGATLAAGVRFSRPLQAQARPMRPPGARPEAEFLSRCIRCARCADACPNQCITAFSQESGRQFSSTPGRGEHGTPVIFPRRQACNLCGGDQGDMLLCTTACPSGALLPVAREPEAIQRDVAMGKAVVDENLCYSYTGSSCGVCVKSCPFEGKALRAGIFEKPIVDPEFCVGCGLCERSCIRYPQAITVERA